MYGGNGSSRGSRVAAQNPKKPDIRVSHKKKIAVKLKKNHANHRVEV